MSTFNKPAGLSNIWAKDGAKITPPSSKISEGWVVEIPPHQYMNHIENKQDAFNAHVNTFGIAKWDSDTQYYGGQSYVQGQTTGITYKAVIDNVGQDPDQDQQSVYWRVAFADIDSPAFIGTPTAPTPPVTDRSTRIATTEYVRSAMDEITPNSPVRKPINVTPADTSTDVAFDVTFMGSTYYSLYGVAHQATQIQVSLNKSMTSIVRDELLGAVTSWANTPDLEADTIYFWRIRYQDAEDVWSEWSEPTQISTGAASIEAPVVTFPTNGATDIGRNPTYTVQPMTVDGGVDTHISTDWEVRVDTPDGLKRWYSYNNTVDKTSINIQRLLPDVNLARNTVYYLRVRFNGAELGTSPWTEISFTTAADFYPTEIGIPYGGGYYAGRIKVGSDEYVLIVSPRAGGETPGNGNHNFVGFNGVKPGFSPTGGRSLRDDIPAFKTANHYSDGVANTQSLIAAYNSGISSDTIQFLLAANASNMGGKSDWYLPSKDELNLLYRSFKPSSLRNLTTGNTGFPFFKKYGYNANIIPPVQAQTSNVPPKTSVSAFQDGGSEAFKSEYSGFLFFPYYYYWSSTIEVGNDGVELMPYIQSMRDGEQNNAYLNPEPYSTHLTTRKTRLVRRERVVA